MFNIYSNTIIFFLLALITNIKITKGKIICLKILNNYLNNKFFCFNFST